VAALVSEYGMRMYTNDAGMHANTGMHTNDELAAVATAQKWENQ
jgi:hypothetical protein